MPTPVIAAAPVAEVSLDEQASSALTPAQLATLAAYQRIAGGEIYQWLAKGSE